jgi:hypothetical protein
MAASTASMRFDAAVRDPIPLRPTPEFRPFTLIALLQIASDPKKHAEGARPRTSNGRLAPRFRRRLK